LPQRNARRSIPYVPTEKVIRKQPRWYTELDRDRLLAGMFEMQPRWYAFFYLTTRLGLRTGEVYAISRDRVRDVPATLIVDRAVQRGYKDRPAMLGSRKNHEVYTTALGRDVLEAIRWHVDQGYAGPQFLFSQDGTFPKHLDSHKRPLRTVQKALGLPLLSHHRIGRHSMASQAATGGQPIRAIQAQLGHRSAQSTEVYAHLGSSAQLHLVRALEPLVGATGFEPATSCSQSLRREEPASGTLPCKRSGHQEHARWVSASSLFLIGKSPYSVIAGPIEAAMTIVAVAHTSREPGYWRGRMK